LYRRRHGLRQVLDSRQKLRIVEDPVIDRQVEASMIRRKQAVQPRIGKHTLSKAKFLAKALSSQRTTFLPWFFFAS
jgi:hypothetical protein